VNEACKKLKIFPNHPRRYQNGKSPVKNGYQPLLHPARILKHPETESAVLSIKSKEWAIIVSSVSLIVVIYPVAHMKHLWNEAYYTMKGCEIWKERRELEF
jgi:hypothetical protein